MSIVKQDSAIALSDQEAQFEKQIQYLKTEKELNRL